MVFTHLFPFVSEIFLGFVLLPALLAAPIFNKWNEQNQSCSPVHCQSQQSYILKCCSFSSFAG